MEPRHRPQTPTGEIIPRLKTSDCSSVGTCSVLQIIADLFPSPTLGQTFTRRFLERATCERSIVPDVRTGDHVICVKSIAALGQELDLSNDTTNKYVLLFKALGLLEKRKIPGGLAFVLTQGIYQPPTTLEANLDYLISRCTQKKSRGKFQRLLLEVKERCQVHGLIAQDLRSGLETLQILLQVDSPGERTPRKLARRVMQAQHLVSTLMAQLVESPRPQALHWVDSAMQLSPSHHPPTEKNIAAEAEKRLCEAPPSLQLGKLCVIPSNLPTLTAPEDGRHQVQRESPPGTPLGRRHEALAGEQLSNRGKKEDSHMPQESLESPQIPLADRFDATLPPVHPLNAAKRVDSEMSQKPLESSQHPLTGRFDIVPSSAQQLNITNRGDSATSQNPRESPQLPAEGRFAAIPPRAQQPDATKRVDSEMSQNLLESSQRSPAGRFDAVPPLEPQPEAAKKVDSETDVNVNVITFIKNITLNVEMVSLFCCKALGEDPTTKRRIYSRLFRDIACDAQAITAALIFVLAHQRDGTIRNPAAVFHKRCKDYHGLGVPEEVAALVEQYGSLPCTQLVTALQYPLPPRQSLPAPITTTAAWTRKEVVANPPPGPFSRLPPIPTLMHLTARIPLREGGGLSREKVRGLYDLIADERRIALYAKGIVALSDGSYAVLVENRTSSQVKQVAFYSLQEWQACSSTMRCGADLFGSHERPSVPRPTFLPQKGAR